MMVIPWPLAVCGKSLNDRISVKGWIDVEDQDAGFDGIRNENVTVRNKPGSVQCVL